MHVTWVTRTERQRLQNEFNKNCPLTHTCPCNLPHTPTHAPAHTQYKMQSLQTWNTPTRLLWAVPPSHRGTQRHPAVYSCIPATQSIKCQVEFGLHVKIALRYPHSLGLSWIVRYLVEVLRRFGFEGWMAGHLGTLTGQTKRIGGKEIKSSTKIQIKSCLHLHANEDPGHKTRKQGTMRNRGQGVARPPDPCLSSIWWSKGHKRLIWEPRRPRPQSPPRPSTPSALPQAFLSQLQFNFLILVSISSTNCSLFSTQTFQTLRQTMPLLLSFCISHLHHAH